MSSPDPISTLRASHERLRTVVAHLTPDQVRGPAYPSEWSVAQTLSHIGSGAEINSLVIEAGLAGDAPPARETYSAIWDTWNAKSPDAQAADAVAADARLIEQFEANRDSTNRFSIWLGEVDISGAAAARLFEHAVHTWDVAVSTEPAATLAADAVRIILPGLGFLVGYVAKPAGRTDRVHITADADEYLLTFGEKSTLEPWDGGAASATFTAPAEAVVRLVYGRLDPAHTPAGVQATGISLDELRSIFPGF